jgi:DNA-binding CsgD family transcriptional regulator/tetratricopeptide (TPR) repeat protein
VELVERDDALGGLRDALTAVECGHAGRTVVVSGEAGIGKTSLVAEFLDRLAAGTRVLIGRCDDLFAPRPLGPLLDVARQIGGRLRQVCDLGEPTAMVEAFLDELTDDAVSTVVVIEDLQWADMATLDLVRLIARRIDDLRALVVLTHRDDIVRGHPLRLTLGGLVGAGVTRLRLAPLSSDGVRRLVGDRHIDADHLHEITGGNPFFVVETLTAADDAIPESIRDAVMTRVDQRSDDARCVLDAAAIIGARVDRDVLRRVVGGRAGIDELVDARLLLPDGVDVRFGHDLVRQAVEQAIPPESRRRLHAAALLALGEHGDLSRRAHHAVHATDRDATHAIGPLAAEAATRLGAHREAAAHYANVLELCDGIAFDERLDLLRRCAAAHQRADEPEAACAVLEELVRMLEPTGDAAAMARALALLSRAYRSAGDGERALPTSQRGVDVARTSGDQAALAAALVSRCGQLMVAGDLHEAVAVGTDALALAQTIGDESLIVNLLNSLGCTRVLLGDDAGWDELEDSLQRSERAALPADIARAHNNLFSAALETQRLDQAEKYYERGIGEAFRLDLGMYRCMSSMRATLLMRRSQWSPARQQAIDVLRQSNVSDVHRVGSLVVLALIRARLGDPDPHEPLVEAAGIAARFSEVQVSHPVAAARAEVAWLGGDADGLASAARELRTLDGHGPQLWYRGEAALWARRAGLPVVARDVAAPYQHYLAGRFAEAAAAWQALGLPYEAADALADSDDPDELRQAYDLLGDLAAAPRRAMVTRSLRAHGLAGLPRGPRPTTRANPAGLTDRQCEVLALLGAGLSNGEIADRLVVARKTVDHHVSAVLQKLGVPDRRAAKRRARELGLLAQDGHRELAT